MTELEKAVEVYIDNPANYLEYQNEWEDLSDVEYVEKAFIAGANWQYEQFEKERLNFEPRLKHCDELTAEQAQMESDFVVQHLKNFNRTPTFIDAIEYGRESMRERLTKLKELADNMYNAAQYLTTDASRLHKAMEEYRQYVINELKEEYL